MWFHAYLEPWEMDKALRKYKYLQLWKHWWEAHPFTTTFVILKVMGLKLWLTLKINWSMFEDIEFGGFKLF